MKKFSRLLMPVALSLLALVAVTQPSFAMKIAQASGTAMIQPLGALANSGTMKIYCGTQPTNPDTALSGNTLAATFTFNSSAFGSATHVSSKMQIAASLAASTVTAAASCTATFARVLASDGTTVIADMTVGTSGTDVVINSTSITSGGNVTISSFAWSEPVD